jgi:hypothetical protein
MQTDILEERITSIFRVKKQPSKKPVYRRGLTTAVRTSNPTNTQLLRVLHFVIIRSEV